MLQTYVLLARAGEGFDLGPRLSQPRLAPGFAGLEPYRGAKAQIKIDNTAIIHTPSLI